METVEGRGQGRMGREGTGGEYVRQRVVEMISVYDGIVHVIRLQQTRHLGLGKPHVLRNGLFQKRCIRGVGRRPLQCRGIISSVRVREYLAHLHSSNNAGDAKSSIPELSRLRCLRCFVVCGDAVLDTCRRAISLVIP